MSNESTLDQNHCKAGLRFDLLNLLGNQLKLIPRCSVIRMAPGWQPANHACCVREENDSHLHFTLKVAVETEKLGSP